MDDFMALVRTRHFSRAAELQHVSQPTFSRRIRLLEDAMGAILVNRQTLPLSLTPAGEAFAELCTRVTRDVRETRERIRQLESDASARISVGSTQGLFSHFYPTWALQADVNERLQLNLKATSWVGEQFLDALDNGDCDLVLCYWHENLPWRERLDGSAYRSLILARETLVPLSAGDEQGKPRFVLPGSQAQPVPLMAYQPRGFLQPAIASHLARQKITANLLPLNENAHSQSVKALVMQGFGMGWLPQRMARGSEEFGDLVRAGDERWDVPLQIRLMCSSRPRTADLDTLWTTLETRYDRPPTA